MSVIIHTRGEAGGGVAAHLHCSHCDHFSKSHAQQLSHVAAAHPSCLDGEVVGRLGTILMYQSTARLFHCSTCFFTCKDFTKLYKHIISKHCMDDREGPGGGEEEKKVGDGGEEEEEEMGEEGEEEKKMGDGGQEEEEEKKVGEEGEEEKKKVGEEGEEKKMGDGGEGEEKKSGDGGEEEEKMGEEGEEEEKKMGEEGEEEKKMGEEGEEEEEKKSGDGGEEEEEEKMGEEGEEKKMGDGGEEEKMGEEGEEEALKRRRSSEEEAKDENSPPQDLESEKPDGEGEENVLMYDGSIYRCLICGCRNKLKVVSVNHVMKKHDIPKAYASQAIRREVVTLRQTLSSSPEEEEELGMTGELLNEEMKATAKLVTFTSNRFVCLICGWKTKLKGFVLSHVARCHDVERPYGCKFCSSCFFLPSRLQQHVRTAHRPGRYACPFCCFRSHYLGGFRRHCSRCNAREGGEQGGAARVGGHQEHQEGEEGEEEEKKKTRAGRKRRMTRKVMEEQEQEEEEDE